MSRTQSPLARPFPTMPQIAGITPRVARAGYRIGGGERCDLTYVEMAEGTAVAGVFTRNVCCSSKWVGAARMWRKAEARALVVNTRKFRAFTGYRGRGRWSRS